MASGKKIPTLHSKALSIAIKRAMATRNFSGPTLAKVSGIPYGTLRRILELNTVSDYEQLHRMANALKISLISLIADAEHIASDPEVIADYQTENRTHKARHGFEEEKSGSC